MLKNKMPKRSERRQDEQEFDVDSIIHTYTAARSEEPGKLVQLPEEEIRTLCSVARSTFLSQNMLLELEAPIRVCGDIHGQFHDLLRLFQYGGSPSEESYLFLGDYVDRGKQGIETICLLFAYKVAFPERMFLLRGNHESADISRIYGFYDECKHRYSVKLWKHFVDVFNCLPVCARISHRILCMHGGISPELDKLRQIQTLPRPSHIPDSGLLCDLLWADPDQDAEGWEFNHSRGISHVFGPSVLTEFLRTHRLDLVCRAHQVVEDGYDFFAKRQLVTVFSAPNYGGDFDNAAAMMIVDADLQCSFKVLKGAKDKQSRRNQ